MRVAFLAPWFSSLAETWSEELRRLGHETIVVTTDGHFLPVRHSDTAVLPARLRDNSSSRRTAAAAARVRRFRADVAVVDETWDPRFHALGLLVRRRLTVVHDARPHDDDLVRPLWQRRLLVRSRRQATDLLVFSRSVEAQLREQSYEQAIHHAVLTSEMPDDLAPAGPAPGKRNFILAGRLGTYKNPALVHNAWERYVASPAYEGDRLIVLGAGDPGPLPVMSEHRAGRYTFTDAAHLFAESKGALCLYSAASQSGVQVMAMQCGAAPVVTAVGGLPEYQADLVPSPVAAVPEQAADALATLTRAEDARAAGDAARHRYQQKYSHGRSAARLAAVLLSQLAH